MKYPFGSIGAGNMGSAIMDGAVAAGIFTPSQIALYSRNKDRAGECAGKGYTLFANELEAFENSDILMLAIKPQGMETLFEALRCAASRPSLIISVITGYSTERITQELRTVCIRSMPNTPLLLGCGATGISPGAGVSQAQLDTAMAIFSSMGVAELVPEQFIDETIPISGSSPAFVYYFIDILSKNAAKNGMDYDTSLKMCAKGFEGAAKMVLSGKEDPQTLIRRVCSPGGATLKGLEALDSGNITGVLEAAAAACVKRAKELGGAK